MGNSALITGITGQDGAYLADFLLKKGYNVYGCVRQIPANISRLEYLHIDERVKLVKVNLLDFEEVQQMINEIKPNEIYNLAAESSVAKSFQNPHNTLYTNMVTVLNLLEAIRQCSCKIKMYHASSSEMYGNCKNLPITEETEMHPISPYALSKKIGYDMIQFYREVYQMHVVTGILFNHESVLRGEGFFLQKLTRQCMEIAEGKRKDIHLGNIDVKRDFGYSPDYVKVMWKMLQCDKQEDYIICQGKSELLRDIVYYVFEKLNLSKDCLIIDPDLYREEEISNIYGDSSKSKKELDWENTKNIYQIIDEMLEIWKCSDI